MVRTQKDMGSLGIRRKLHDTLKILGRNSFQLRQTFVPRYTNEQTEE